jgi:hypothetical protein
MNIQAEDKSILKKRSHKYQENKSITKRIKTSKNFFLVTKD